MPSGSEFVLPTPGLAAPDLYQARTASSGRLEFLLVTWAKVPNCLVFARVLSQINDVKVIQVKNKSLFFSLLFSK